MESTEVKQVTPQKISKKEIVIRIKDGASRLQKEAPDVFADSDMSFGSFFDGSTPVRPLNFYEEEEIMPKLIGVSKNSPDFESKVEDFMHSLTVKVHPRTGKTLNVTIRQIKKVNDGNGEEIVIEIPEAPLDYLMYRLALKHHRVAKSFEESIDAPNGVKFYIEDKEQEIKRKANIFLIQSLANKLWIEMASDEDIIKQNAQKISHIFELTRDIHDETPKDKKLMEKVMILNDKVVKEFPEVFSEIAQDKNLENKVLIVRGLEYNVLTKIGNTFYDNDEPLGESLDEVVLYMNNPKHSDYIGKLTARIEQAKKTSRA